MGIRFSKVSRRLLLTLGSVPKRTLLVGGLVLAAAPVTAAVAMHQDTGGISSKVTIQTGSGSLSPVGLAADLSISNSNQNATNDTDSAKNRSTMSVNVNGQDVAVPANGTVDKTITTGGGNTSVHISNQSSGTTDNNSSNSTQIKIKSSSSSSADGNTEGSNTNIKINN